MLTPDVRAALIAAGVTPTGQKYHEPHVGPRIAITTDDIMRACRERGWQYGVAANNCYVGGRLRQYEWLSDPLPALAAAFLAAVAAQSPSIKVGDVLTNGELTGTLSATAAPIGNVSIRHTSLQAQPPRMAWIET